MDLRSAHTQGLFFTQGDSESTHPQMIPLNAGHRKGSSRGEMNNVGIIELQEDQNNKRGKLFGYKSRFRS